MRVSGNSMQPALQPGDALWLEPVPYKRLNPGEIVAFRRGHNILVHRLIATHREWFLCKGDRLSCPEPPIAKADLLGRVAYLERRGARVSLPNDRLLSLHMRLLQYKAHFSSSPYSMAWRYDSLLPLSLAGMEVLLLLPKALHDLDFLSRCRMHWSRGGGFMPWLVRPKLDKRTSSEDESNGYFLNMRERGHHLEIVGRRFVGRLDRQKKRANLRLSARDASGSMENFLRVLTSLHLLKHSGVLLHAAAVVREGKAYLFFGPSGSGKSTLAALSKGDGGVKKIVSDDLVAIRYQENGFYVDGLPFKGSHPQAEANPGVYPIKGIFRLQKSAVHKVESLTNARAVATLAAATPFVNQQSLSMQKALATLERLVAQVPVKQLCFRRDAEFWQLIR